MYNLIFGIPVSRNNKQNNIKMYNHLRNCMPKKNLWTTKKEMWTGKTSSNVWNTIATPATPASEGRQEDSFLKAY